MCATYFSFFIMCLWLIVGETLQTGPCEVKMQKLAKQCNFCGSVWIIHCSLRTRIKLCAYLDICWDTTFSDITLGQWWVMICLFIFCNKLEFTKFCCCYDILIILHSYNSIHYITLHPGDFFLINIRKTKYKRVLYSIHFPLEQMLWQKPHPYTSGWWCPSKMQSATDFVQRVTRIDMRKFFTVHLFVI